MNVYVQSLSGLFLGLTAALLATLLVLAVLPTHGDERHTAIKLSMLPFVENFSFLTDAEASHMRDVEHLFWTATLIFLASWYLVKRFGTHRYSGYGIILVLAFITGSALKGFGGLWEKFHAVFFPQGNWQFPMDSVLIQLYPESYFFTAALLFGAFALMIAAVFLQDTWRKQVFAPRPKKVRLL